MCVFYWINCVKSNQNKHRIYKEAKMFNNFSEDARKVIILAKEEMKELIYM